MATLSFDVLWNDRGAAKGLKALGGNADQAHGKLSKFTGMAGKGFKAVGGAAVGMAAAGGAALLGAGVAATAFGVKSVQMAGKFESSMRLVGVTTGVGKKGLKDLTDVAIDMGAKTSFSAQGASDAMLALAKGGMSAAQIKAGALQQTLTLATAGGLELGSAADFMVQGLNAFGLKAGDAARVSAALAGGANASTASVESMGQALAQTAAQAKTAGLSIEDTVAALAAFDNAGIKGSDAGTSLKTMLQRLVPSTAKAKSEFKELGLITADGSNRFFDAKGNIKSIVEVSGLLQNALKDQTKEQKLATLSTMFGSDASRAAAILAEQGAKGLAKYVKATNDKSAAENLAKSATQGYAGAMEKFQGSLETVGIQAGTKLLPSLTKLFNFMSDEGIPAVSKIGSDLGPAFKVVESSLGSLAKVGVGTFKAFASGFTGGTASFKSFANYISTHQADIMSAFITGGKAALMFGRTLATTSSTGLRAFAFLLDGITGGTEGVLGLIGKIAAGTAAAFGWIPGLGPKLKGAVAGFNEFSKSAIDGSHKAADGARSLADGIDKKVVPAIDKGAAALDAMGKKEIIKAAQRDQVAKFAIALQSIPKEKRAEIKAIFKRKGADEAYKAMARIKDKQVIARSKTVGTKDVKALDKAMIALKDRKKLALARAAGKKEVQALDNAMRNIQDRRRKATATTSGRGAVVSLDNAMEGLKNRKVSASASTSGTGGVVSLRSAINSLRNKTVFVRVKREEAAAFGGKMGLGFADGGSPRMRGKINSGTYAPRADDVEARLSRNEWVIQAPSARKYGDAAMSAVNQGTAKILLARGGSAGGRVGDLVGAGVRGGATIVNQYTINAPNYVGPQRELVAALYSLKRSGQLDKLLR